ncbi:MAG: hypothetical protein Q7J34_10970 [Bacteroidales bacterium]|nr:hypothetical protein [Bacteroidales bacterium]
MSETGNNKTLQIGLGILLLLAIFFGWQWLSTRSDLKEVEGIKDQEKISFQQQVDSLMGEHNRIKAEYGQLADSLSAKDSIIQANATEIRKLLDTKWEYVKVMKKLNRLRTVSQNYLKQMDSLYTVNRELTRENTEIKEEFKKEQRKNETLNRDKEQMATKITQGSMLSLYNITATGMRDRSGGREEATDKGKRIEKIKVCFAVSENILTPAGKKNFFVRIADPNGAILVKGRGDDYTFNYKGETLQYSISGSLDYQNKSIELCLYWNKLPMMDKFITGNYHVGIFYEDAMVGETTFSVR